MTVKFLTDW